MRIFHFLVAVLSSSASLAIAAGEYSGHSSTGFEFSIFIEAPNLPSKDGYHFWALRSILMYQVKGSRKNPRRVNEKWLPANCTAKSRVDFLGGPEIFTCSKSAETPLSEVEYRLNKAKFQKNRTEEMVCTSGCNSNIPKTFLYFEPNDET